ncbi:hypothetical protein J7K41_03485 [Candidatus Micrarchaeota archaeon]|nr:hypothetical protein [Candidatus Micrarchaeota archaeon]
MGRSSDEEHRLISENQRSLEVISSVISESRTIIAIAGILFGFLLSVSANHEVSDPLDRSLLIASLICSVLTVGIFSLPVIYHHIEFPYHNPRKFALRYHWFMSVGFIPYLLTFFFSILFALRNLLGLEKSVVLSILIFVLILLVYVFRKKSETLVRKTK